MPKKKADEWPSPSPGALFDSAAATQWLMHYWVEKDKGTLPAKVNVNTAWISALALPGSCLAQQSTGSLVKVVASAEYAFLAWELTVEVLPGGDSRFLVPVALGRFEEFGTNSNAFIDNASKTLAYTLNPKFGAKS